MLEKFYRSFINENAVTRYHLIFHSRTSYQMEKLLMPDAKYESILNSYIEGILQLTLIFYIAIFI